LCHGVTTEWVVEPHSHRALHLTILLEPIDAGIVRSTTHIELVEVGVFPNHEPIPAIILAVLVMFLLCCAKQGHLCDILLGWGIPSVPVRDRGRYTMYAQPVYALIVLGLETQTKP
jgi:hypothetical protein